MLVDGQRHGVAQIQHLARVRHRQGQVAGLAGGHALVVNRHGPGRHLVIGDLAAGQPLHEEFNFRPAQRGAVALLDDDVNGAHQRNHSSASGGHSSLWSARSAQLRLPLQLSIRMAYTLVRLSSWSVMGRNSRPAAMAGKYLLVSPYSARRFSAKSSSTRAVP